MQKWTGRGGNDHERGEWTQHVYMPGGKFCHFAVSRDNIVALEVGIGAVFIGICHRFHGGNDIFGLSEL